MNDVIPSADRTVIRCLVCGSSEVRTDEVIDRGLVLLSECPRCDRRWTARAPLSAMATVRPALRGAREVARAA